MVFRILLGVVVAGGLIQLIPTGYRHTDPAVIQEPSWDNPYTRELAKRACFNCHSNETVWPWYSGVAPVSWLTERDVKGGRSHLNFSEWNKPQRPAHELADQIRAGRMPPWFYRPMHPESKLTPEEKTALIDGLQRSLDGGQK
jgi:mono/diheme cytochrome c family protein